MTIKITAVFLLLFFGASLVYAEEVTLTTILPQSTDSGKDLYAVSEAEVQYDPSTTNTKVSISLASGIWLISVSFEAKRNNSFCWKLEDATANIILIGGNPPDFYEISGGTYYKSYSENKIYTVPASSTISLKFYPEAGFGYLYVRRASIYARKIG